MKKPIFTIVILLTLFACKNDSKVTSDSKVQVKKVTKYPSDVLPFMDEWKILLGDGTYNDSLVNYAKDDFFYVETECNNQGSKRFTFYNFPRFHEQSAPNNIFVQILFF